MCWCWNMWPTIKGEDRVASDTWDDLFKASSSLVTSNPLNRSVCQTDSKYTSRFSKYNSQNKSPVYCQPTNFAHTSKEAVIKQKVVDEQRGKRKEALFFGLTLPYKQTSYGTAKVHTLNLLECSEFNGLLVSEFYRFTCLSLTSVQMS